MSDVKTAMEDNQKLWNQRVAVHISSDWYKVRNVKDGIYHLDDIERNLIGDIKGKTVLHLQCHFGLATLALARLGAHAIGLDFSIDAIEYARHLAENYESILDCKFICADVREFSINKTFDIIFTSWGVLTWLPDLEGWAKCIAEHLTPDGKLVLIDSHPVPWVFCDSGSTSKKFIPNYPYFQSPESPSITENAGTYVDPSISFGIRQANWNHPIGNVITSLANFGIYTVTLTEYDRIPWCPFENMIKSNYEGFWCLEGNYLPLSFSIIGRKR